MSETSGVTKSSSSSAADVSGVGDPTEATVAFLSALSAGVKKDALTAGDARVTAAFALGWQMAELFRPDRRSKGVSASAGDLPGISKLTRSELQALGVDQVGAGIAKTGPSIIAAGLIPPDVAKLAIALTTASDTERTSLIRAFHVELLSTLTAADFRLGKAYGLGRALADTTRDPPEYKDELGWPRVTTLTGWIRELATALPPHAANPVAESLEAWSRAVAAGKVDDSSARRDLAAQGRVWRGLLSGERRATDVLEADDYVRAGVGMLRRTGGLALGAIAKYWWLALIAVVVFAVGIGLITTSGNGLGIGAGAAAVLTSLGISWKGIGTSLGSATGKVEQPLWEAELDTVVYQRITGTAIIECQPHLEGDRHAAALDKVVD
jgi:hypothetical protein